MRRWDTTDLVKNVLQTSDLAKNDRNYLYTAVCIDNLRALKISETEIATFLTLMNMCPTRDDVVRSAAHIQNTLGICKASPIIQEKREKKRRKMQGIFSRINNFLKNL